MLLMKKSASRPRGRHWFPWQGWRSARRRGGVEPTDREKQEMAALMGGYDEFKKALVEDQKARAYLVQRALPLEVAQMIGGAYVPWSSEIAPGLSRFADHLIFPYTPQGFLGRTLRGWEPGITEEQHRKILLANKMEAYWSTSVTGFLPAPPRRVCVMVEGVFDGLSLLAAGLELGAVLVTAGPIFAVENLPSEVKIVVVALDGDKMGKQATKLMTEQLTRRGVSVITSLPPDDGLGKDWNERWQTTRENGLTPVLDAYQAALALRPGEKSET